MTNSTRRAVRAAVAVVVLGALGVPSAAAEEAPHPTCRPTSANRPVCPRGAPPEAATFLDPTAKVSGAEDIELGQHVYIGPFAELDAEEAPIKIGEESNVQDNSRILADATSDEDRAERLGLDEDDGVRIGPRVIAAHGITVKGPAIIGEGGHGIAEDPESGQNVFLSFGVEVDGAILETNTGVAALGRVGPGVRLRSGTMVLPGKNVDTQREADDPSLGKVRPVNAGDVAFNLAVIEVNLAFAREYSRMYYENPSNVYGINFDPGHSHFNHDRDLPQFAGVPVRQPSYRNRIIGDVDLSDTLARFDSRSGSEISLRADEGEPFEIGHVEYMSSDVIFHALEHSELFIGDNVKYGRAAIVHGGGRAPAAGGGDTLPTVVEDNVILRDHAVVFRSRVGAGATIGYKSAVVNTDVPPGGQIPDRSVYINDVYFGPVEW